MHCPAGVPHSPRSSPDSFLLALKRKRRVEKSNYNEDPVSRVYEEYYSSDDKRTCRKCGHVAQRPAYGNAILNQIITSPNKIWSRSANAQAQGR
jgi:hypothetical protein